jgi:hypothetical protein
MISMITKIQPVRKDNADDVLDAAACTGSEYLHRRVRRAHHEAEINSINPMGLSISPQRH